jgi:hypothetical protein
VHLDKYLGVCVAAHVFSARILSSTFVNAFSCLLSIQHLCMKDAENCYDDCAEVNVHWAGKNAVSYKEKHVKWLQVDKSAIAVW